MAATNAEAGSKGASFAFDVEDLEYLRHGDKPLLLRLYKPRGKGPFPFMVDLHGGAWCNLDRTSDVLFSETLAKNGIAVAALDFRMPPDAPYPASLADINYAIRWLKGNAARLGLNGDRVGLIGISSGGHQAMLSAMRPADPRYAAIPYRENPALDAKVACAVLVWPVIDPLGRFHHAKRLQASGATYPPQLDSVIPAHIKFWGDEATMDEGSPVRALDRGEPAEMPPVLYVQGAGDVVHPRADLERFVAAYVRRGGSCDLALYEGEAEGFIRNPDSKARPIALQRIVDFVQRQLG